MVNLYQLIFHDMYARTMWWLQADDTASEYVQVGVRDTLHHVLTPDWCALRDAGTSPQTSPHRYDADEDG